MTHTPPAEVDGEPVEVVGDPLTVDGEEWVTLIPTEPDGDDDGRIWEFSITTGRTIQTVE